MLAEDSARSPYHTGYLAEPRFFMLRVEQQAGSTRPECALHDRKMLRRSKLHVSTAGPSAEIGRITSRTYRRG